ncbi:sulfotransferase domain-containing protein [Shewanella electrodiphila]|uniref:Sulfotransferase domain-containing protein n=1 Tax=Shewanella electrodiphila TaxID=934143 RepID=A0ABT0KJZ5_9GAMM|nr:sulfotransferase domain-containing protein [Shewanella electrodiphila]MCL1044142.1 sulfotransferase domain-containing protein [Shewanella electrodiphila]
MKRFFGFILNRLKVLFKLGSKPDFLILGAQKAGTTSLFYTINSSSNNFCSPRNKELYFFSENYYRGIEYYTAQFPIFRKKKSISGEATPDYLFYHRAPERIKMFNPDMKFVIVLRDPIERAFSQYNHQNFTRKTIANDPMSFSNSIRKEESRYDIQGKSEYFYEYKYFSYKKRGLYEEQIERWFEYFPREQFFFIDISELNNNGVMTNLFNFLGLDDSKLKRNISRVYNKNETDKFTIKNEDVNYLNDFYKGRFSNLEKLTGRTFSWTSKYE